MVLSRKVDDEQMSGHLVGHKTKPHVRPACGAGGCPVGCRPVVHARREPGAWLKGQPFSAPAHRRGPALYAHELFAGSGDVRQRAGGLHGGLEDEAELVTKSKVSKGFSAVFHGFWHGFGRLLEGF